MTTPKLVPYKAEHLLMLAFRDSDRADASRHAFRHETDGIAFTAIYDDKLYGCAGIVIEGHIGVAWAVLTTELMTQFPIWTTRIVRTVIRQAVKIYKLQRVEMAALSNRVDWGVALGFTREQNGIARNVTHDGRDLIRLEMIP